MSEKDATIHDDMLFNMLKECKTLPTFLDHMFGFLQRRTDFYFIARDANSPIGLPEGLAQSLTQHSFLKWKPKNDENVILQENDIPPAINEEEVILNDEITTEVENLNIDYIEEPQQELNFFTNAENYNGATYENYCWSQNISDLDITIKLPDYFIVKDLSVKITTNTIDIRLQDDILLKGSLCQKCKNSDAIWSIDKQKLYIHLDKCREIWWDCLITTEDRLDLSKIDCSRPFEELSEEAQAKIEELGWNQERKRQGLPTSDELHKQEMLKKAWNAEGSPFVGPFDPDKVIFNSN
ncbi:hypothetical protein GWI33_021872 [Rhynchophorus ferrugineus]|uniref:Nuclear migration protein nudC n=1 Tax=Rhynchophorus ferrugineus TaxID=354439 RepID=A0A834IVD1_RHYFE|nr:hypothetical protein GWI33_021872 [Rhynchophorus ferrugineus]